MKAIIGLLTALFSLLLLTVLFSLINAGMVTKDNIIVQASMAFIIFSPLLAIILTSVRLRFQNSSANTFGYWVKTSFINFLITAVILSIVGLLITKQKDIFRQLFFERFYIVLFVPLIGLTISAITTLVLNVTDNLNSYAFATRMLRLTSFGKKNRPFGKKNLQFSCFISYSSQKRRLAKQENNC